MARPRGIASSRRRNILFRDVQRVSSRTTIKKCFARRTAGAIVAAGRTYVITCTACVCVCVCFGKTRKSSKRRRRRCQSLEQSICSLPEDGDTCGATQIVIERAEGGKGRDRLGEEIVKERRWEGRKEWAGGGGCGSAHYYGISDPRVAVVSSV